MKVFKFLKVFNWRKQPIFDAVYFPSLILAYFFFVDFLVDNVLFVWSIVKFRAGEFEVVELFIAKLAREYFKLIRYIPYLISNEAKKFIVHITSLEDLNEAVII